jgi:hypothetical protein
MFVSVGGVPSGAKCAPASVKLITIIPFAGLPNVSTAPLTLKLNGTPAVTFAGAVIAKLATPAELTDIADVVALIAGCASLLTVIVCTPAVSNVNPVPANVRVPPNNGAGAGSVAAPSVDINSTLPA